MRTWFIILLTFSFMRIVSAQNETTSIEIKSLEMVGDSLRFVLGITNHSDSTVAVLKPKQEYICVGIMKVIFLEVGTNKTLDFFPCDGIYQLDMLFSDCDNTILLKKKQTREIALTLDVSRTTFLSRAKSYKCYIELNMKEIDVRSEFRNIVTEDLRSNAVILRF